MITYMQHFFSLLLVSLLGTTNLFANDIWNSLTNIQREDLKKGATIKFKKDLKKGPWPRLTLLKLIDATPLAGLSIFSDYEDHKSYIPNMIKSKLSNTVNFKTHDVDFKIDLPWPVDDAEYTARNILKVHAQNDYSLHWHQLKSNTTDDSLGHAHFSLVQELPGKTLVTYQNFVIPKSFMAKLFRGKSVKDSIKSFHKICKNIEDKSKNASYQKAREKHTLSILKRIKEKKKYVLVK